VACHTSKGGKSFAGGLSFSTPIGTIYSTNITPDTGTGIGSYTYSDFESAVRRGVAKDGHTLYPAMPYPSYAKLKNEDVAALYYYFMHGVPAVQQGNRKSDIPWPLSMRWPLAVWRHFFAPGVNQSERDGDASAGNDSAVVARGRYLVEGLGHCGACHTPRGVFMQEITTTDNGDPAFLSGGKVENWLANDLRNGSATGLGSWTPSDIVSFLKSGRNEHSAAFGGMREVVVNSTQYMSDQDLNAIAIFLKQLGADKTSAVKARYDTSTAKSLQEGQTNRPGALTFLNNCAACHRSDGKGYGQVFPQLALSATVNEPDPTSLIHIVLRGASMPGTSSAPTSFTMPGFHERSTDQEIADVVTFIRTSWGNKASAVTARDVGKLRSATR